MTTIDFCCEQGNANAFARPFKPEETGNVKYEFNSQRAEFIEQGKEQLPENSEA
ncbi:hypothetical protein [Gimesia sp.]|uniref:hypothetical protein n=1 Tax=Gimesia sp. TaxID=2024833 RepID=UPI0025BA2B73|nr:hypothetical protein [Gimesia sp.]|tara:strand:- start:2333 stop:2494 length:162 start_codon:yes stop_codon:yes gene_type:complete